MELLLAEELWTFDNLVALLTLTALEIVLGIDNVIFIAILTQRLPANQQAKARTTGLALAAITRVLLLLSISWVMGLTAKLFTLFGLDVTGQSLILFGGGLFLIAKATYEIHDKIEHAGEEHHARPAGAGSFTGVVVQILLLDIVFSLDSVITAVGMSRVLPVMITAILIAVGVMLAFAGPVSRFVEKHPTMRILALAFLVLIGVMLVAEGFHHKIPRGYIYFAMAFSFVVELLNLRVHKARKRVAGRTPGAGEASD